MTSTETPAQDDSDDDLDAYASKLVADWPPFTTAQRARLAGLLRPVVKP